MSLESRCRESLRWSPPAARLAAWVVGALAAFGLAACATSAPSPGPRQHPGGHVGERAATEPAIDFSSLDMGASGAPMLVGDQAGPGTKDDFDLLFERNDPLYVPDDSLFTSNDSVCPKGNQACERVDVDAADEDLALMAPDTFQSASRLPSALQVKPEVLSPVLKVEANAPGATVYINGKRAARAGEPFTARAGSVIIEVQAPGYKSFKGPVSIKNKEDQTVTVQLIRE